MGDDAPPPMGAELAQRRQTVLRLMGELLYLYQAIEVHVKLLVPSMRHPDDPQPLVEEPWRRLLDSRTTLGPVFEAFKGRMKTDDVGAFDAFLHTVVQHRNELVHHFIEQPFGPLDSTERCEAALAFLEERGRFVAPLAMTTHEMVRLLAEINAPGDQEEEPA